MADRISFRLPPLTACLFVMLLAACDNSSMTSTVSYPDADGPDFQVFAKNCSHCHAPPAPDVHVAEEWPAVIARMDNYRVQRAYGALNAGDKRTILRYLADHAAKGQEHETENAL